MTAIFFQLAVFLTCQASQPFFSCVVCQKEHILENVTFDCVWNPQKQQCVLGELSKSQCPRLTTSQELKAPNNALTSLLLKGERLDVSTNILDVNAYLTIISFDRN